MRFIILASLPRFNDDGDVAEWSSFRRWGLDSYATRETAEIVAAHDAAVDAATYSVGAKLIVEPAPLENIAVAFNAIAEMAHEWAEDFAGERGRDYDAIRARLGNENIFFREAMEELSWQASDASRQTVPVDFEIEF